MVTLVPVNYYTAIVGTKLRDPWLCRKYLLCLLLDVLRLLLAIRTYKVLWVVVSLENS